MSYLSWKDYTEALDEAPTEEEADRLDAAFQAEVDAQGEEAEAEADAGGPQDRVYYVIPAGSDHPLPAVHISDPGDGDPPTYTLGGQSCGRDVAAWAIARYRAKRAEGGRLMRIVSGRGFHAPPRPQSIWGEMDGNIVPLVDTLNALPAVQTFASCGGHEAPEPHYQHAAGTWFVSIEAAAGFGAWSADLALLRRMVAGWPGVRLEPHKDGYFLSGAGVEPDEVATAIREGQARR